MFHTLDQEVGQQRVPVLGNEGHRSTLGIVFEGEVVVVGFARVDGREQSLSEPVFLDETLFDDEQHLGPDFTDRVDSLSGWDETMSFGSISIGFTCTLTQ
jgi:hypothetical protein